MGRVNTIVISIGGDTCLIQPGSRARVRIDLLVEPCHDAKQLSIRRQAAVPLF